MSIPVEVDRLAAAFEVYDVGYLLTSQAEGGPRAATVRPRFEDGLVKVGAGRSSSAAVATHPAVTLLCAPPVEKGHTLIVDATAEVVGEEIHLTPTSAVLHRPPFHADGPPPPDLD